MTEFTISEFEILKTGVDGGHIYIRTEIIYKGFVRKLVVLFSSKADENKLEGNEKITVSGKLIDQGIELSLMLLDAEIK